MKNVHVTVVPEDGLYLPLIIRKGMKQLAEHDSEIRIKYQDCALWRSSLNFASVRKRFPVIIRGRAVARQHVIPIIGAQSWRVGRILRARVGIAFGPCHLQERFVARQISSDPKLEDFRAVQRILGQSVLIRKRLVHQFYEL